MRPSREYQSDESEIISFLNFIDLGRSNDFLLTCKFVGLKFIVNKDKNKFI
jgi:hypothetical protein